MSTSSQSKIARFNAYSTVSIFSNLPLQVDCITGYDDQILVGTNKGHLLIYKICFNTPLSPAEINLTHSNKYFSKKPIIQLDVIPEHKILISLTTDNGISVHDVSQFNCPAIRTIERTKGATLFALDIVRQTSLTGDPSITVRMCVVVGKRLQLFYWKNRGFYDLQEDLAVPDCPRAVCWSKDTLCVAFKSEYCLINHLTGEQEELFSTSKQGEPIIAPVLTDNFVFALVQDRKSILISGDRSTRSKMQGVDWMDVPSALVYDEPYMIAISGKNIEIRTIHPKLQIDSFPLPGAKLISRTKRGHIYVASSNSIWCVKSCPVETQIASFLEDKQFEIALSLARLWDGLPEEQRQEQVERIQKFHAINLFCSKDFVGAMDIFSELEADASHVIGLFPDLLPPEQRNKLEYPSQIPELQGKDLEDGLSALVKFLIEVRRGLLPLPDAKSRYKTSALALGEGTSTVRTKNQLLQIIDTTLLKCYLQINESLIESLVRLKNYCHLEESERALKRHGKLKELVILYETRGLHKKALELLMREKKVERIIQYLQHLGPPHMDLILEFSKQVLIDHQPLVDGLRIFTEDIQEVESLPRARVYDFLANNFLPLVIPYLEHIIHVWSDKNAIFHNALIIQYRERLCSPNAAEDPRRDELQLKMLEFLQSSEYYTAEHVLVHFPYAGMYEERALLHARIGRHDQALQIYITKLKDKTKALEYCKKVYERNNPAKKDVFTILMKMLLNPPNDGDSEEEGKDREAPDLTSAIKLLRDYAPCIEPFRALKCLPDDTEVNQIQNFLKTSVQNHFSERRRLLIQKGLTKSEYLRASAEKSRRESEMFNVSENTVCDVCRKRFANQSAFARYPDGSIVHFSCQDHE